MQITPNTSSGEFPLVEKVVGELNEKIKNMSSLINKSTEDIDESLNSLIRLIEDEIKKMYSKEKLAKLIDVVRMELPVTKTDCFISTLMEKLTTLDFNSLFDKHSAFTTLMTLQNVDDVPIEVLAKIQDVIKASKKRQHEETAGYSTECTPPPKMKKSTVESDSSSDSSESYVVASKRIIRGQPMNMSKLTGQNYVRFNRYAVPTMALALSVSIYNFMNGGNYTLDNVIFALENSIPTNCMKKFKRFDGKDKQTATTQIIWFMCKLFIRIAAEIIEGTHPDDFDVIFPKYQTTRRECNTFHGIPADTQNQISTGTIKTKSGNAMSIKSACMSLASIDTSNSQFIELMDIMKNMTVHKETVKEHFKYKGMVSKFIDGETTAFKVFLDVAPFFIKIDEEV